MELVVILITGAVIYYVVTGFRRWWDGYRKRHNLPLQVVALTVIVLVAVWASQSSTGARIADLTIGVVLVFVVLAVAALAVAGWRRGRSRQAAASQAAARSRRPPTRRSSSRRWRSVYDAAGREVVVYAFGAFDKRSGAFMNRVKFGHSAQAEGRRELQVANQLLKADEVRALGRGPGGEPRERALHRHLDRWRYPASEWFEASPEVLAAVGELERLTEDGRRLTQAPTTRSA